MAGETSGRLDTSTLRLLADAASTLGYTAAVDGACLRLRDSGGRRLALCWPSAVIPKSNLPRLLRAATHLACVPTLRFRASEEPPFLPGCAKPDRATRGQGFVTFRSATEWRRRCRSMSASYVVQPLLEGSEYRVTVCRSGTFAAAKLVRRTGRRATWRDEPRFPRAILADLLRIAQELERPGVGFDIMRTATGSYLLDANLFPSLAIHSHGEPPRDIARPFLLDWLELVRG